MYQPPLFDLEIVPPEENKNPHKIYLLWAEFTTLFKIGITSRQVGQRALDIQSSSPYPLRVIGHRYGTYEIERSIHRQLVQYKTRGEWYDLPEPIVWQLIKWLGFELPPGVSCEA
jgi:hypothetical protein